MEGIISGDSYVINIYWGCKYDGMQMHNKWQNSGPKCLWVLARIFRPVSAVPAVDIISSLDQDSLKHSCWTSQSWLRQAIKKSRIPPNPELFWLKYFGWQFISEKKNWGLGALYVPATVSHLALLISKITFPWPIFVNKDYKKKTFNLCKKRHYYEKNIYLLKGNSSIKHVASHSVKDTFRLTSWPTDETKLSNEISI